MEDWVEALQASHVDVEQVGGREVSIAYQGSQLPDGEERDVFLVCRYGAFPRGNRDRLGLERLGSILAPELVEQGPRASRVGLEL